MSSYISATGVATKYQDTTLAVWYPAPVLEDTEEKAQSAAEVAVQDLDLSPLTGTDPVRGVSSEIVTVTVAVDEAPQGAEDAYVRLHALSHRLVRPNEVNVDGIFGQLENVVWTSRGACSPENFEATRVRLQASGPVAVYGIDKFPRMTDFVVPSGVRIADADRVRMGAYLSPGTTVMHEGFVNFNAGTLGAAMVEGRISQGVVVGDGSDIGGGASIMGTLSGGGKSKITIGTKCLLGANAGIGISLGDNCVVEAGLYVTAGTRVTLEDGTVVKASELSGKNDMLLRRNSESGVVEALPRTSGVSLNPDLH